MDGIALGVITQSSVDQASMDGITVGGPLSLPWIRPPWTGLLLEDCSVFRGPGLRGRDRCWSTTQSSMDQASVDGIAVGGSLNLLWTRPLWTGSLLEDCSVLPGPGLRGQDRCWRITQSSLDQASMDGITVGGSLSPPRTRSPWVGSLLEDRTVLPGSGLCGWDRCWRITQSSMDQASVDRIAVGGSLSLPWTRPPWVGSLL
ncbi:hypothetical protein P7K49_009017 [Saguinus oedipus]|uniref:Uncharacterized protein n=1 Tax=Saguinus oedipus TaxID=9490 RepID=A0ABQ9VZE8_SAGOE|nr:hypothetical protein P7K49_009017 [Saguinus oedipus]